MNILIPSLEKLSSLQFELLILNLFYSGIASMFIVLSNRPGDFKKQESYFYVLKMTLALLGLIVIADLLILPIKIQLMAFPLRLLVIYCAIGVSLSIASELFIGFLANKTVWGRPPFLTNTVLLSSQASVKSQIIFQVMFISIPVLEEIALRGVVLPYLMYLGFPFIFALTTSTLAFGLNHFFRGSITVIQKSAAGAIFGLIFYLSGFSLLAPIIIHVSENYLILLINKLKNRQRKQNP